MEKIAFTVFKAETQQQQLRTFAAAMCNKQSVASASTSSTAVPTSLHALKPAECGGRGGSESHFTHEPRLASSQQTMQHMWKPSKNARLATPVADSVTKVVIMSEYMHECMQV